MKKDKIILLEPPKEGKETKAAMVCADGVHVGYMGDVQEGSLLNGKELIRLSPHDGSPIVWNVDERTSFRRQGSSGPAMVNSASYRDNYNLVFGRVGGEDEALPN